MLAAGAAESLSGLVVSQATRAGVFFLAAARSLWGRDGCDAEFVAKVGPSEVSA